MLAVARWRQASQRIVRSDLVVSHQPLVGDLLHVGNGVEQVRRQHFLAERAVEAFDEGVLIGFAGLDEPDLDALGLAPLGEGVARQFGAVVSSNRQRRTMDLDELIHEPDHPAGRNAGGHIDAQTTTIGLVDDVQRPKRSAAVQAVVHEVQRPDCIDLCG